MSAEELRRREPNIVGTDALFVRETGIVDYGRVASAMGGKFFRKGGGIQLGVHVGSGEETSSDVVVGAFGGRRWTAK